MKITFLGTNGWYDSATGNTPCTLVETKKYYLVFDAGNGIYKLGKYVKKPKPVYLFISHFHIDHVSGLHILPKFNFKKGLKIFMEKGRMKDFKKICRVPFMTPVAGQHYKKYKVEVSELNYGINKIPFRVECFSLRHMWGSLGFRIEIDGKIISHGLDTGYCDNLINLAKKADIMITEAAVKNGKKFDTWGHLDPVLAAQVAVEAGVKKLAITHFGADQFLSNEERKKACRRAKKIFPKTIMAEDGLTIKI